MFKTLPVFVQFIQKFQDIAEQGDAWLASKEAFLTNEDLGVGISYSHFYHF